MFNFTNSKATVVKNYSVRQYQQGDYENWNLFIGKAKNATFLFHRDFMEYHSDRFEDYSLLIFEEEKLLAVLPANKVDDVVYSHQGLSYGGLLYGEKLKLASVLLIFRSLLLYLNQNQVQKLHIKIMPSIYHDKPAEELNYALFLVEAKLEKRETLSVIDLSKPFSLTAGRKEGLKRGYKNNLVVKEELNFDLFWDVILTPNLYRKFSVNPVHSKEEIIKLNKLFPNNIKLFTVYKENEIVAGTVLFVSENVVHSQYISANEQKNELGSLDFLYHYLLKEKFNNMRYFDLGSSNRNQGRVLNNGLSFWKESFGASTIVQDFYEVKTNNYPLLDTVLL